MDKVKKVLQLMASIQSGPMIAGAALMDFLAFAEGQDSDEALEMLKDKCAKAIPILNLAGVILQDGDIANIILGAVAGSAARMEQVKREEGGTPFTTERKDNAN